MVRFAPLLIIAGAVVAAPHFTDVTETAGFWRVPTGWGVTAVDYEGDGDVDLVMANNGSENALYLNQGGLVFRGQPLIGGSLGCEGLVPTDLDRDGQLDLLSCTWGGPSTFLKGIGGGWFQDVTKELGLRSLPGGRCGGAAFGDLDGDGRTDLHHPDAGEGDRLYLHDGEILVDVTDQGELGVPKSAESSLIADFDDDGALDIYVPRFNTESALYLNIGPGLFNVVAGEDTAFAVPGRFGAAVLDVENDGNLDLLLVRGRFRGPMELVLLVNDGEATFTTATPAAWAGRKRHYQTACAGDIDNDGDLDVFTAGPDGTDLWLNDGEGQFTAVDDEVGWSALPASGALLCDLDGDGNLDILVRARPTEDNPIAGEFLYRNDLDDGRWLKVQPIDRAGSRFCHGAQVRVYEAGGLDDPERLVARRDVTSACGWGCYLPFTVHFGVDEGAVYDVDVRLADGACGVVRGVKPGGTVTVKAE